MWKTVVAMIALGCCALGCAIAPKVLPPPSAAVDQQHDSSSIDRPKWNNAAAERAPAASLAQPTPPPRQPAKSSSYDLVLPPDGTRIPSVVTVDNYVLACVSVIRMHEFTRLSASSPDAAVNMMKMTLQRGVCRMFGRGTRLMVTGDQTADAAALSRNLYTKFVVDGTTGPEWWAHKIELLKKAPRTGAIAPR